MNTIDDKIKKLEIKLAKLKEEKDKSKKDMPTNIKTLFDSLGIKDVSFCEDYRWGTKDIKYRDFIWGKSRVSGTAFFEIGFNYLAEEEIR